MILLTRFWRIHMVASSLRKASWHQLLFALAVPMALLLALPARAEPAPGDACSPSGIFTRSGGPEVPGGGYLLVCDGSEWHSVLDYNATSGRVAVDIANDTGSCTAAKTGRLRYDDVENEWEYCNGSDPWLPFKQVGSTGLSGPAGCDNIGDLCADGTVFAGFHPILHEHLFIPPPDQGTTIQWKTSSGTNDIASDSDIDGRVNTDQVANSATFPAFKLCKDLGTGGHGDWYLPSRLELSFLYSIRDLLETGGNITNFQNVNYWSSTEPNTTEAYHQGFANGGGQVSNIKTAYYNVRCVRR